MSGLANILTAVIALSGGTALLLAEAEAGHVRQDHPLSHSGPTAVQKGLRAKLGIDGRLYVPVLANGQMINFMVDTGASHTLIDPSLALRLGLQGNEETRLMTIGGVIQARSAYIDTLVADKVMSQNVRVIIVDGLSHPILGMDILSLSEGVMINSEKI